MKTVSGRMPVVIRAGCHGPAPPGHHGQRVALGRAEPRREAGVQLHERARRGGVQLVHAPGLGAGLVLGHYPAGGEEDRVLLVRLLGGGPVRDRHEPGPAVVRGEPVEEETGRAGVDGAASSRAGSSGNTSRPASSPSSSIAEAEVVGAVGVAGAAGQGQNTPFSSTSRR